jgi:hypothetical protein
MVGINTIGNLAHRLELNGRSSLRSQIKL